MHEIVEDLRRLQALLDESMSAAGAHLRSVITPERRLGAAELCERLQGMTLLALATASADGRPFVAPVDGIFFRGSFHFGSSPDSLRFRHIRRRPEPAPAMRASRRAGSSPSTGQLSSRPTARAARR